MIKAPIEFHCDGCPRTLRAEFTGEFRQPDLGALGCLFGWRHFLRGPLVCNVCAENEETLARLKRQWMAACDMVGSGGLTAPPARDAHAQPRRGEHTAALPAHAQPRRCEDTPALPKRRRRFTDAEIQAAYLAHPGNKSAAARSIGMTVCTFYKRLSRMDAPAPRAFHNGHLNGATLPSHP